MLGIPLCNPLATMGEKKKLCCFCDLSLCPGAKVGLAELTYSPHTFVILTMFGLG